MLVLVQAYFDIDELDEDQVELNAPIFNVSYSIVQQLVELDCFPQAYEHQASCVTILTGRTDIPAAPHSISRSPPRS